MVINSYYFFSLKYEMRRLIEKFWMFIAWHLPKVLVMWCSVRLMAHATTGQYGAEETPALLAMDALKRWETA